MFVYAEYVSRRRLRHQSGKAQRQTPPLFRAPEASRVVVREAARVERLAYTRTQAAEALGISRSTFNRRVLPLIDTVAMPWGTRLIPVDELQRLARRAATAGSSASNVPRDARTPRRGRDRSRRPHTSRTRRRQQPRQDRARAHRRSDTDGTPWRAVVAIDGTSRTTPIRNLTHESGHAPCPADSSGARRAAKRRSALTVPSAARVCSRSGGYRPLTTA